MKPLATLACCLLLTGCSAAPSVTPSPTAIDTAASSTTATTTTTTKAPSYTTQELALLAASGFKPTADQDVTAFLAQAHKLCTAFATATDDDVFSALKDSTADKRKTAGQILMFLCEDDRYTPLIIAAELPGSLASGTYYVGTGTGQIPPGAYRTIGAVQNCYWVRKNKSGGIIDNDMVTNAPGGVKLTVKASDYQVTMSRCGVWIPDK